MVSRYQKVVTTRLSGLLLLMFLITPMHAAIAKVNTSTNGVAVHGYDVVAYFLEGRAVRGTSEFEHDWQDAKWQFASAANKDLFAANPQRYVPQYGGFCATCLALDGELRDANPKAWTIIDGKLYLNYSMHQRTQWRIRSDLYVKYGDDEWTKVVAREKKPAASDGSYRIAVIRPTYYWPYAGSIHPETLGNLGGDIYRSIRQLPSFSITHADEPADSSALAYLNRGGDWPFSPTNVEPSEAWQGEKIHKTPNLERLYRAGQELELDAVLAWFYKPIYQFVQWPVEVYVIDVEKQRVYLHEGVNTEVEALVRQALDDFRVGREGYRIAVMKPAYFYAYGAVQNPNEIGDLGGDIYKWIRQQPSIFITHADEPVDPSALGYLNRGGDWPYPATNVAPSEVWQQEGKRAKKPNLERLYRTELGVDAVVMWYYKPLSFAGAYPVDVYVIDIKRQKVYRYKGSNTEASRIVGQAFRDFVAGRNPQ